MRIPSRRKRVGLLQEQEEDDNAVISALPDAVLTHILSYSQFKEAVATSVLSKRWKHLWKFTSDRIHLGLPTYSPGLPVFEFRKRMACYAHRLKRTFRLHKSMTIKELRVRFDLKTGAAASTTGGGGGGGNGNYREFHPWRDVSVAWNAPFTTLNPVFEECLEFVSVKRVEILELDLSLEEEDPALSPYLDHSIRRGFPAGFESLKDLILKRVTFSGELVHDFLKNCPFLERLSLQGCSIVGYLWVVGPSLALKYLEIRNCCKAEDLVIANIPTLTRLMYTGMDIQWSPVNVPLLVDVLVSEPASPSFSNCYAPLSGCLSQLETLTVEIRSDYTFSDLKSTSFKLPRLKKLVLKNFKPSDDCLLQYSCLIERSPLLKKFVLHTVGKDPCINKERNFQRKLDVKSRHEHLEEVELADYYGRKSDHELVIYFIENTVFLKKIRIHLRDQKPESDFKS